MYQLKPSSRFPPKPRSIDSILENAEWLTQTGAVPDSIPANEQTEIGNNLANSVWVKSMLARRDAKLAFPPVLVTVPVRTLRKPTVLDERSESSKP